MQVDTLSAIFLRSWQKRTRKDGLLRTMCRMSSSALKVRLQKKTVESPKFLRVWCFFFSAFRVFHLLFVTHKEKNNSRVSAHTGERGNLRAGGKCNSFCGPAVGVLKGFQKAGEWTERCRNYSVFVVFFCGFGTKTQFGTDWKIELWWADSRTDLSTVSRGPNKIKEDT